MKRKCIPIIALIALVLLVGIIISPIGRFLLAFLSWEYSEDVSLSNSYDGKLVLSIVENKKGGGVKNAKISILDATTNKVLYLCENSYRSMGFHGAFWGNDSYTFWVASGDVGTFCFIHENGSWVEWYVFLGDQTIENKIVVTLDDQKREILYPEIPKEILSDLTQKIEKYAYDHAND